jgi:hypothetical protein
MQKNIVLSKTSNGAITFCEESGLSQLHFNNFCFSFKNKQFDKFCCFFLKVNPNAYSNSLLPSKPISIPIGGTNICMILTCAELDELKTLIAKTSLRPGCCAAKDFKIFSN